MIQLINKLKKNQKGFTLVELIVVLVILAILAAFTIPAMLGFINDARGKAGIAEAREVYMAYTTSVSEVVLGGDASVQKFTGDFTQASSPGTTDPEKEIGKKIQKGALAKLEGDLSDGTAANKDVLWKVKVESGKVTEVKYNRNGYTITLDMKASGSEATVEKQSATEFSS